MPKNVSFDINLVPKDPFFQTFLGKILKWALSVGRYIVIFTELIVILSFVTRFSLDRQVTDLNDSINQKKNVIESFGDLETNVLRAQKIIDQYEQVEQQTNVVEIFPALSEITPREVTMRQLIIKPGSVDITGSTFSQQALNNFISNMQISPHFTEVEVTRIETDQSQSEGFLFSIRTQTPFSGKLETEE